MPRRPLIHLDGVPLHIVQRGHNREPCFFGADDYAAYLHWLNEALVEAECALHAYVLMRMRWWGNGHWSCRMNVRPSEGAFAFPTYHCVVWSLGRFFEARDYET